MLGTFVSKSIPRSAKAVCSCTILCLNLKTVNCTRRGLWDRLFGQGFDSPHLHQQVIESQRCDSFFCFIWEERMARGIWIANKKREVKAFFTYEEAEARRARMKAVDDPADGSGPICGSNSFFILTLIDIHDIIQIENIRYYKRRYQP